MTSTDRLFDAGRRRQARITEQAFATILQNLLTDGEQPRTMPDKTMTEADVIGELRSGMTIGIGGWGSRRKPMSLVRAMLRSDLHDLTIVTYGGPDAGLLLAAGKVKRLIYGFVSLDSIPLEPHFRAARQAGTVDAVEYDEGMFQWGLYAASLRLPFLPTRAGLGSDVLTVNPGLRTVRSPYDDGEELLAMPALHLDAALVHLNRADRFGAATYLGPDVYFDDVFSAAADRAYLSCEKIVPTDELSDGVPLQAMRIHRWMVHGVVEAPAVPTSPPASPTTDATRRSNAPMPTRPPTPSSGPRSPIGSSPATRLPTTPRSTTSGPASIPTTRSRRWSADGGPLMVAGVSKADVLRRRLCRRLARRRRAARLADRPGPGHGRPARPRRFRTRPPAHRRRGHARPWHVGRRHCAGRTARGLLSYRGVFDLVWRGRRHIMMGPSQIDRYGNANISCIGDFAKPKVQLLGVQGPPATPSTIPSATGYRSTRGASSSTASTWSPASATTAPLSRRPPAATSTCAGSSATSASSTSAVPTTACSCLRPPRRHRRRRHRGHRLRARRRRRPDREPTADGPSSMSSTP